jgi:hypothetical protein
MPQRIAWYLPRWFYLGAALAVSLLILACDEAPPRRDKGPTAAQAPSTPREPSRTKSKPPVRPAPPKVTAEISNVAVNWRDEQQTFSLTLKNQGDEEAAVRAIIYAKNDQITPPRRAVSPPTAYPWFQLAHCKDGSLTPRDIERSWTINAFGNGRSGKLVSSWPVTLPPGGTHTLTASHVLERESPHEAWAGKPLARAGFTEYHIWLFTPDGECFWQKIVPAEGRSSPPSGPRTAVNPTR